MPEIFRSVAAEATGFYVRMVVLGIIARITSEMEEE